MTNALQHRGPDDEGVELLSDGQLAFGHRRLSILDLSPLGHQPMMHPSGRFWITFNGEIYNFRQIRSELTAAGDSFRSESDTEVILAAYARWGRDCLQRFRGMFALAIWDIAREELVLIRDRFGVKPLYYSVSDKRILFASEMRGILVADGARRGVSVAAAAEFLRFGYVSAPGSMCTDIATVPPGCIVTVDRNLRPSVQAYWSPDTLYDPESTRALRRELAALDEQAILDRTENTLTEAFGLRMVSDVPVGLFLSGGIDSTIVATLLARRMGLRPRTYTIGYADDRFNEIPYARAIAREIGTEHTELEVSESLALETATELLDDLDEPVGDSSIIPTKIVCALARRTVKVALSADGADELFGGYARYDVCARFTQSMGSWMRLAYLGSAEVLDVMPPSVVRNLYHMSRLGRPGYAAIGDKVRKFVRMTRAASPSAAYEAAMSEFSSTEAARLLARGGSLAPPSPESSSVLAGRDNRDAMMLEDIRRYLPGDLLTKLDRASMAASLEARDPFLDHNLAALAAALPMNWKIRDGQGKYILRRILSRHLRSDLFNRPKQGFSAPIGSWLRGVLRPRLEASLLSSDIRTTGLFDSEVVARTVRRFLRDDGASAAGVWHLLRLQSWASRGSFAAVPFADRSSPCARVETRAATSKL